MPLAADYPLLEVIWTMVLFFLFILWIFLLIRIITDVFRRAEISGSGKAAWTIFIILLPFLGVLVYLITQGDKMVERDVKQAEAQQQQFDEYVRSVSPGGGAADEIAKAKQLLESGAISQAEFDSIKARALAS